MGSGLSLLMELEESAIPCWTSVTSAWIGSVRREMRGMRYVSCVVHEGIFSADSISALEE